MRLAVHQRQIIDAKGGLQEGVFEELVQLLAGHCAPFQLDDNAHPLAVAFIPQARDAVQASLSHQSSNALDKGGLVHLVGDFSDNDAETPAFHLLNLGFGAHDDPSPARGEGLLDALQPHDDAASGKIGSLDKLHQFEELHLLDIIPAVDHVDQRIGDLSQVVRRNVGGHAHGDTAGSVQEQIGQPGRQHFGLHQ